MIRLFVSYYQCGNKKRQKELDFCWNKNNQNPLIDHIVNFENRPTYNQFFEETKNYPYDINILANADIYFNDTLALVKGISPREAYALTRWEVNKKGTIVPFEEMHVENKHAKAKHSQDVWVFKGAVERVQGNFHLGRPGCDNRIAAEIRRAGYKLSNPSFQIQCIHKHREPARGNI